jgi:hypothetical protein
MHSGLPANSFMAQGDPSQDFASGSDIKEQGLNRAQMRIFLGALQVQEKTMKEAVKNFLNVHYFIDLDTVIDETEIQKIKKDGYSRKPIVLNRETSKG